MNLHLFRDIAVTTSVHAGGHAAKAVSTLIHHASQRVSNAHYNQARGIEAADRYQDIVERMREAARARAGESRRGAPCVR